MIDSSQMLVIVLLMIVVVMGIFIWRLMTQKPIAQPITKNQYERLNADFVASARLNKVSGVKWIGITGDAFRPEIRKYFRYKGDVADGRMLNLCGQVKLWSPKRWLMVPWDMVENYGHGKTMWIRCNGFDKDGYFLRPVICKDHILDGHTTEYYDNLINQYITKKLSVQALQDQLEQNAYETVVASAHKERPLADMMQKQETIPIRETDEIVVEPEM